MSPPSPSISQRSIEVSSSEPEPSISQRSEGSSSETDYIKAVIRELCKTIKTNKRPKERHLGGRALFSDADGKKASEETVLARAQVAGRYHPLRVANGTDKLHVQFVACDPKADAKAYKDVNNAGECFGWIKTKVELHNEIAVEASSLEHELDDAQAHIVSFSGHALTRPPYAGFLQLEDATMPPDFFALIMNKLSTPASQGARPLHGLVLNACTTKTLYQNTTFSPKPGYIQ
jgi:hypothetical protein